MEQDARNVILEFCAWVKNVTMDTVRYKKQESFSCLIREKADVIRIRGNMA